MPTTSYVTANEPWHKLQGEVLHTKWLCQLACFSLLDQYEICTNKLSRSHTLSLHIYQCIRSPAELKVNFVWVSDQLWLALSDQKPRQTSRIMPALTKENPTRRHKHAEAMRIANKFHTYRSHLRTIVPSLDILIGWFLKSVWSLTWNTACRLERERVKDNLEIQYEHLYHNILKPFNTITARSVYTCVSLYSLISMTKILYQ